MDRSQIKIHNADCMEAMRQMSDNEFDLAIVDPPYGIGAGKMQLGFGKSKSATKNRNWKPKDWDNYPPSQEYFDHLFRISKNQIVFGANYLCNYLPSGKGWIFWNKLNGIGTSFSDGEFVYSSKGVQSRYYECYSLSDSKNRIHPTQKPVQLYKWLLTNYAKEGDKILDTHLGSGSIAIACWDLKFDLTGYEIDKEYYDNAVERLERHKRQMHLF